MTPGSEVEQKAKTTPKKSNARRGTKSRPDGVDEEEPPVPRESNTAGVKEAVIPDWTRLPYLILLRIFQYAAAPLTELREARWLTAASGVCRAFAEPALTALYECPPLLSRSMAHGLVSLLSKDPSTTLFNYRVKVRELWVDVEEIASKTYRGQPLDIEALVRNLPQLKSIRFFHQKDDAPYRSLDGSLRWHYPAALFEVLNGTPVPTGNAGPVEHARLSEWQWNRRLMGPKLDLAGIKALHQTPAFLGLKKLSFVNYQVPSLYAKAGASDDELASRDLAFVQSMADAITAVPTLQHLAIESSTVVNDRLLPLLPKSLQTLELVNCWDVNSEDFASYLLSSGSQLRHLILRHNQSLSLSFVTVLATACPRLELLYVDFKTYKHHEFYKDSDPSYDELLTAEQVPEWPQSLEALHLLNMKKWEAEAAENLIQSLIDSAPKLLKLRQLELKAMLSIPIHERSQLRNKWGTKLKRVFLREKKDPKPFFSLSEPAQQAATEVRGTKEKKSRKTVRATAVESPSRRSARLAAQFSNPSSRASSVGRDLRSGLGRPFYAEPDTDVDEEDEELKQGQGQVMTREGEDNSSGEESSSASPAGAPAATKTVPFRHGMCEKVVLQLDNQKLVETALTMDDFLDSEGDDLSDDDWAGEDEDFDSGYAW
ncbi:9c65fc0d-157d-45e2-a678-ec9c306a1dd9 [Thermothielavioides terrestris]|uniref:9c65fc0d-157d-45e2-a678-ec9c306a1dd9 n=1 Tax=Thermothielavioides terrestris TaxID=2587410 RepID=A0A446BY72_9PEZI|nr:9c65fc0d-157d-45e2-a678-ec9c306a1dd9 [Thermothielavioides terrestris]